MRFFYLYVVIDGVFRRQLDLKRQRSLIMLIFMQMKLIAFFLQKKNELLILIELRVVVHPLLRSVLLSK